MRLPTPAVRRVAVVTLCLCAGTGAATAPQSGDEPAPKFTASDLLPASLLSGPHFTVSRDVVTEGYFHEFALTSDYGPFTALGRSTLETRVDEIRALGALDEVSKSAVFMKAAGGAVVDIGKGAARAVTSPVDTAKGIGAGVKRFGVNLGRVGKRAVTTEKGADTGESSAEAAANAVLGVSSAMRQWARKVGADPYTTNLVLREALKSIAQVDAAGSIAAKMAVPIPAVVGTTATVGDLVWSKDPEELRKFNEARLTDMGVGSDAAAAFLKNGWFTLSLQTRIIAALTAVRVPGATDYLATATSAESEHEAQFFVESAEMLQRHHAATPVTRLLTDSRAVVALTGRTAVVLAPIDYVRADRSELDTLREIGDRAGKELGAGGLALHLTGQVSDRAKAEASRLGWTITERVGTNRQ